MTSSNSASSRMTSKFFMKFIYSSHNSSAFSIFKKSSSFSNSSKSVFFLFEYFDLQHSFHYLHWVEIYQRKLDVFHFDLSVSAQYSKNDVLREEMIFYRNVNEFLDDLEHLVDRKIIHSHLIMKCCFANCANEWFYEFSKFMQTKINKNIDSFCFHLFKTFDFVKQTAYFVEKRRLAEEYRLFVEQQVKKVRLIKKRAEQQAKQVRFVEAARLVEATRIVRVEKKRAEFLLQQQIEQVRIDKKRAERLLQQQIEKVRIAKKQKKVRLTTFACKRCSAKFSSNIKLHIHVQNHHQKKSAELAKVTQSESAIFTSIAIFASIIFLFTSIAKLVKITTNEFAKITSTAISTSSASFSSSSESTLMFTSFIDQSKSIFDNSLPMISSVTSISTSISTSKKSIFWVEIVSRSVIASKSSRLPVATLNIVSRKTKNATSDCSSTSFSISLQKSTSKHQKSYLTIADLFEMFAEKRTKSDLQHIKKIQFFSKISHQFKITFYFRSAANHSKPISQNSKISNSMNFQQHTFAKSNRVKFTFSTFSKWFEKSIILSYKLSTFFRLFISEISSISLYKMSSISRFQSMIAFCKFTARLLVSSTFRVFLNISDSRHVCRICSDIFESNNCLHRHLRAIHFSQASRSQFESSRKRGHPGRNLENSWSFDEEMTNFLASYYVLLIDFSMNESHVLVTQHNENAVIFFVRWHFVRWHLLR